jgi:hypothetical protein
MSTNYYVFVDSFVAPCNVETAYQYIKQIEEYPRWWGNVYKKIVKLKDAPPDMPGARYAVTFGGFLPYTLTIENEVTLVERPRRIEFDAFGDLEGKGIWKFEPVEGGTKIIFDWRVAANKPIIRAFSFLLKPLFKANHAYCVRKANEGLRKDLALKHSFSMAAYT